MPHPTSRPAHSRRLLLLAILAAMGLTMAACSSDASSGTPPEDVPGDAADVTAEPDAGTTPDPAQLEPVEEIADLPIDVDLALEPVATLFAPTAGATRPGHDSLFVAEQTGRVVELAFGTDGESASEARVIVDIRDRVLAQSENGLLGIAFSPDGNRLFAVFSNLQGDNDLVSWEITAGGIADPETELLHMQVPEPFGNHNGGQIVFGPDGYLYYGLGDGGSSGDPDGNGQNTSTLLGSILRIDPDMVDGGYDVPADNPFVDSAGSAPEIWAYGMRNPWRFSFDPATGDLWVSDVGEGSKEEIDLLAAASGGGFGANLGWNAFEGTDRFADVEAPSHLPPILEYGRDDGRCAIIGGYVYRGEAIPVLEGTYLYSDYCDGVVRGLLPGVGAAPLVEGSFGRALSFAEGPDGEIYLLEGDGTISRLVDQNS